MTQRIQSILLLVLLLTLCPAAAHAEEPLPPDALTGTSAAGQPADAPPDTAPVIPTASTWTAELLIAIAGLFLAAAVIGPIVRAEGESVPSTFSHHEDPRHHTGKEPDAVAGAVE
jgi:hypothetical protein